jgi:hypothetical protein
MVPFPPSFFSFRHCQRPIRIATTIEATGMATPMIIWSVVLRLPLWPPLLLVPLEGDADAGAEGVYVAAGIVDCPEGVGWDKFGARVVV